MKAKKRVLFSAPSPVLTEKNRPAPFNNLAKNPSIPVLTDILPSTERKRAPAPVSPPARPDKPSTVPLDKLPWDELEERLTVRIRTQVMERLNFVLDDNLSQHISSALEQVVTLLADEIRHDMQKTLEVIITHTISAELQQLRKKQLENKTTPPKT